MPIGNGIGSESPGNGDSEVACPLIWFFRDDSLIRYNKDCVIVALYGRFGLWPENFRESLTKGYHLFGTYEKSCLF